MKKIIISLVMILTLMFNIVSVNAAAMQNEYPESKHNYGNDLYEEWFYSYDGEADCLFVTFSQDTYFGPGGKDYFDREASTYSCDYIVISSDADDFAKTYFADELAGQTILVPGSEFWITLSTDSSKEYYGFKITDISTQGSLGDYVCVTYKIDDSNQKKHFAELEEDGSLQISGDFKNRIYNDKAIIGWKDGNGHEYIYKNGIQIGNVSNFYIYIDLEYTNVFELKPGDEIVLTPIYTSVSITPDETFSFYNDKYVFNKGYKMTNAHTKQLRKSYKSATKNTEFGFLGYSLGLLLPGIYQIIPWHGSCCGFPIAALMQHYGMIDLCSEQNVSSVSSIKPTDNIKSTLNYYNAVTPAAIVCSNKAPKSETDVYKAQIKNLFETVSSGKPVVCFINCDYVDGISYKSTSDIISGILSKSIFRIRKTFAETHCILLTGAYTDGNGNRIFIGYDENNPSYCNGEPQIYRVNGDFKDIVEADSFGRSLGSIAWFDDVSFMESFKADGETDSSAWYSYFCENREKL